MKTHLKTTMLVLIVLLWSAPAFSQGVVEYLEKVDKLEKRIAELEATVRKELAEVTNAAGNQQSPPAGASVEQMAALISQMTVLEEEVRAMRVCMDSSGREQGATYADLNVRLGDLSTEVAEGLDKVAKADRTEKATVDVPGTLKPSAKAFFYYFMDAGGEDDGDNAFDLSRMYMGFNYIVSKDVTICYGADVARESGNGKFEVYSKYAYLDWQPGLWGSHLILGLQGTNIWSAPEAEWGYRVIRKAPFESFGEHWKGQRSIYEGALEAWANQLLEGTPTQEDADLAGELINQKTNIHTASATVMGSSIDIGVGFKVKPTKQSYANFLVRNGSSYKAVENDIYKNYQVRVGHYFLDKSLHISGFAELEPWKGVDDAGQPKRYMNTSWDVMVSYKDKKRFHIGFDAATKIFPGNYGSVHAWSFSGFGNINAYGDRLKPLVRYDYYRTGFNALDLPDNLGSLQTNASLVILGVSYAPVKYMSFVPNIQLMNFEEDGVDGESTFYIHVEMKI